MASIAVIGTGYVGLTTGVCFAHLGHDVVCADVVAEKVERLSLGEATILERGLDDLLREGIKEGRLRFVLGAENAVEGAEFVYLCVPTPQGPDGSADMSYIEDAARVIAPRLVPDTVVVNKSTVPVGSTRLVEQALGRSDIPVVSNPEFLREGSAISDFLKPDRVVIGSDDQNAAIRVAALYIGVPAPLMVTDPASAETIKYASNAFLATKLSFVNAVAAVCEAVGADVNDVVLGMGYDKRIGSDFLKPGPGWGGSCFVGSETVLARRGDRVRLLSFEAMAAEVADVGAAGWEVYAWAPDEPTPAFFPIAAFTERAFHGEVVEVRTEAGRQVTVTPDHPFVVGDGSEGAALDVRLASDLEDGADAWLPVAQGMPMPAEGTPVLSLLDGAGSGDVSVRLGLGQFDRYRRGRERRTPARRDAVDRTGVLRLDELDALGIPEPGGSYGTVDDGTVVPATVDADAAFWRVVGLFVARGRVDRDGRSVTARWILDRHGTDEVVETVAGYWRRLGVTAEVRRGATTGEVSVRSRILASFLEDVLGADRRIPDQVWGMGEAAKRALLRGLFDGGLTFDAPSGDLADGVLRLLGDLGTVAARTTGPVPGTHRVRIDGARHRPPAKGAAWVRVAGTTRRPHDGPVYSVEVPGAHTVVTTAGLIAHNCFPKDTRAMLRIAQDGGYDFNLLQGVLAVNDEQFERTAEKVVRLAGGSVEGVTVAVWGLTFKAGTDDLRESPALQVIDRLVSRGANIRAHDPTVTELPDRPGIEIVADPYAACEGAAVLVVLTEWDEFKWLDLDKVAAALAHPRVVDGRNLLDRGALLRRGFTYAGVGRS
jgi:UDPglucose 6-dehydrogenase